MQHTIYNIIVREYTVIFGIGKLVVIDKIMDTYACVKTVTNNL